MEGKIKLLKIYISTSDRLGNRLLYEEIVREGREAGLGGATVYQGIMSFGASHSIHGANVVFPTHQIPVLIEFVDEEEKINRFFIRAKELIDESQKGALVTLQDVDVLLYKRGAKYNQFSNF
ncbi:DUF190 domain-containing protein [Mangrovibacterium marinum]|uniref:Uncharacterized protein n=1 Tax=Mangrovibacterium marinum TaxID=1639118 RepID=A0A2T5BZ66_9BACT|nr:DUF190 domain-containing protein [Mangrovibacterium marinum]PTN07564.1 hypothetical protein C8N47_1153 [Mangrovibacterium marinum]